MSNPRRGVINGQMPKLLGLIVRGGIDDVRRLTENAS